MWTKLANVLGWVLAVLAVADAPEQLQKWHSGLAAAAGPTQAAISWLLSVAGGNGGRWAILSVGLGLVFWANSVHLRLWRRMVGPPAMRRYLQADAPHFVAHAEVFSAGKIIAPEGRVIVDVTGRPEARLGDTYDPVSGIFRPQTPPVRSTPAVPAPDLAWNSDHRERLLAGLRPYADSEAMFEVLFSRADQRPIADSLVATLELGGWRADLTTVPLDRWLFDSGYFNGVEVQGYNKVLVAAVTNGLSNAELGEVRSRVDELKVPRDNPKWRWANSRIKITIGHSVADTLSGDPVFRLDHLDRTLRRFGLRFDGLSSPQEEPTPDIDNSPTLYFKLASGKYLRMTGADLTPSERDLAGALALVHEAELKARSSQ